MPQRHQVMFTTVRKNNSLNAVQKNTTLQMCPNSAAPSLNRMDIKNISTNTDISSSRQDNVNGDITTRVHCGLSDE